MTRNTLLAVALLSCPLPLLTTACKDESSARAQAGAEDVKVFKIRKQQVTDTGEWFGYLRGKMDTDIYPRVSGFLISQEYKDGQYVNEGDILFRLDPNLYEAEYAQAQANLKAAMAELTSAQASRDQIQLDVNRFRQLVKSGSASEKDLSDAEHNLRAANATVDASLAKVEQQKAAVNKARIDLEYTVVRAPYSGIAGTALASKGDLVGPTAKLANLTSIDPIRVDFSVSSEKIIESFRNYGDLNAANPIHPAIQLLMEDGTFHPYEGRLLAMESKVDATGLINVEGEVPNPEGILRGGMPVRIHTTTGTKEALLVPEASIRPVLRSNFIILVDKENIPHTIPVELDGEYNLPVTESNGYSSEQKMVAIKGVNEPLENTFRQYGYEKAEDVPVVTDPDNGVRAMNISSANSRLDGKDKSAYGRIRPQEFTFRPELSPEMKEAASQQPNGKENPDAKPTLSPFKVKVAPLLQQDVTIASECFGSLRGVEETDIRPKVSGFLLKQHFNNGSLVKKGDVLFTIDPAPYQAALDEAQANLLSAKAAAEQAQAKLEMNRKDYDRYVQLVQKSPGAISEKTVTDAKTAVETAEADLLRAQATIAQMEAAVQMAEINLGYTTITAPFDGRAGLGKPSIGALVSPDNSTPLVTLSSIDPMRVDFQISGKMALSGISLYSSLFSEKAGKSAAPPEFEMILEDNSLYPVKGHVVSADNALSTTTGTLKVSGHIPNVGGGLRSGMAVRVRAGIKAEKNAFLVPARAPMNAKGKDMILLLRPDNTPDILPITKGALVVIPVKGQDGNTTVQPMQIIEADRSVITPLLLMQSGAPNLETILFNAAKASNWDEFLLQKEQASDFRALIEKQEGSPMPDNAPEQAGVQDWKALLLSKNGVSTTRGLVLKQAGAKDELDLIAQIQGFKNPTEMALKGMGFDDIQQVQVIAEGAMTAAMAYQANQKAKARVNKLAPAPFLYSPPRTVVDSVTADRAEPTLAQ